jgi:hypothetical protein
MGKNLIITALGENVHRQAVLYPGQLLLVFTDSRLGEPHKSSGHFGEKKNVLPLPRIKTRFTGHLAHS